MASNAKKKNGEKKMCLHCAKEFAVSSFYLHRNSLINEKFGICKKCARTVVDFDDMKTLYIFLQTMDIPYLREFWKMANEANTETLGNYLKNVNSLKQNRNLHFKDSDDMSGKTNKTELMEIDSDNFEVTDDIIRRWGRNLELSDYIFLEEEFYKLGGNEAEDTLQERLFKNMARTLLTAEKALENDDANTYEKMMKIFSTQMNDANIKPVQVKANASDGEIDNWGQWVELIEREEPIEEGEKDYEPKFVGKYVNRFFISQIGRIFGRVKDEDIKKLEGEE